MCDVRGEEPTIIIKGPPRKKQYRCSFQRAPKISRINEFYRSILGEYWEIKIKKTESEHYTFWNCYMKGAPRKKQYCFFFSGAPKITKINYFCTCSLGRSRHTVTTNQNKVLHFKIPGCSISKLLYTVTLVLPRSTWNFKKSDLNTFTLSK